MPITSMTLRYGKTHERPRPHAGDIKVTKKGAFIRRHTISDGCYMVRGSSYYYHWERVGDAPEGHSGRPKYYYRGNLDSALMARLGLTSEDTL